MTGDFSFPTRIVFGPGRVRELPELVRGLGTRPLIVTDPGVVASGALQPVLDALAGVQPVVFDGVEGNPVEANVLAGVQAYRDGCDFVIAVGGGSPIDAAKAIRLLATHPGDLSQYVELNGGYERITADLPPMVAIPTTAGTGSEVGRSTVITLNGRKSVIFSPHLMPTIALCDPELTVGMPPRVTAGTGADALIHNLEAFFSRGYHPLCDAIALDGMGRAMRALPEAVRNGKNIEARADMLMASMMGAIAFQKGLGVVHSLSHPLSTVAGVHHGTANALMLPHALRFNREAIAPRAGAAAYALGIGGVDGLDAVDLITAEMRSLFAEIGLPARLREVGVTSEMIPRLSDLAIEDGCHLCNPRPVTRDDMAAMYEAAL